MVSGLYVQSSGQGFELHDMCIVHALSLYLYMEEKITNKKQD